MGALPLPNRLSHRLTRIGEETHHAPCYPHRIVPYPRYPIKRPGDTSRETSAGSARERHRPVFDDPVGGPTRARPEL